MDCYPCAGQLGKAWDRPRVGCHREKKKSDEAVSF